MRYLNVFTEKLKEVLLSVIPIIIIVMLLNFTLTPLETPLLLRFGIGSIFIILGLAVFLIGVEIGITPLSNLIGSSIAKINKLWVVIIAGLILGFFICIAEPDLLVFSNQVDLVTSGQVSSSTIVIAVSIGLAIMLSFGLARVVYNIPLYKILTVLYLIIFIIALFTEPAFLAIAFDASGATTGALAVPFILALSIGVSTLKKDSKSSEKDSFGLVAIASIGAIISVMILSIFSKNSGFSSDISLDMSETTSILGPFINLIPHTIKESFIALLPLIIMFLILQKISFKLSIKAFNKILKGFIYTLIGLVLFLVGVNAGFMDVGNTIGYNIGALNNNFYIIAVGFILGLVTILAEPAVYVLTHQIEDVTSGYVNRKSVLIALSLGVGVAIALSMIRILIPQIQLWHYILPGYAICIAMTYFVPKLFVGMAFDAGGVATGPMTATFILAFTHGVAESIEGANVLIDGFGMIAMVAMTPIITLQILGLIFKLKSKKGGGLEDEQQI